MNKFLSSSSSNKEVANIYQVGAGLAACCWVGARILDAH